MANDRVEWPPRDDFWWPPKFHFTHEDRGQLGRLLPGSSEANAAYLDALEPILGGFVGDAFLREDEASLGQARRSLANARKRVVDLESRVQELDHTSRAFLRPVLRVTPALETLHAEFARALDELSAEPDQSGGKRSETAAIEDLVLQFVAVYWQIYSKLPALSRQDATHSNPFFVLVHDLLILVQHPREDPYKYIRQAVEALRPKT